MNEGETFDEPPEIKIGKVELPAQTGTFIHHDMKRDHPDTDYINRQRRRDVESGGIFRPDPSPPNIEIERKFLVKDNRWLTKVYSMSSITQGYLTNDGSKCIRIRRVDREGHDSTFFMTTKSCEAGMSRTEVELPMSHDQFLALLPLCSQGVLRKKRFLVSTPQHWEIDVFEDGLTIAEIELDNVHKKVIVTDWLDKEVTNDKSYYNAELVKRYLVS